jgi:hypothetical protein
MSETDLLAAAQVSDAATRANLTAETQYYLGQWALLQGNAKAARQHFEAAAKSKAGVGNLEAVDAGLELKRLAKKND